MTILTRALLLKYCVMDVLRHVWCGILPLGLFHCIQYLDGDQKYVVTYLVFDSVGTLPICGSCGWGVSSHLPPRCWEDFPVTERNLGT